MGVHRVIKYGKGGVLDESYAAGKIADSLKKKGATLMASPEGFFVKGKEGPLKEGELERAAGWAKGILETRK
jgi:flavodoxin I